MRRLKRGRPRFRAGTARKIGVEVKVSQHDLAELDALASSAGKTRSTYCYEAIVARLRLDAKRKG